MKTLLSILVLTVAVYLHATQLRQYDEETTDKPCYCEPTWLVQDSTSTNKTVADTVVIRSDGGDYN